MCANVRDEFPTRKYAPQPRSTGLRNTSTTDLRVVVDVFLNPVLRGWGAYFRVGNSSRTFAHIDNYVRQRIARLASVKHGLSGINWGNRFDYNTWLRQLGIYELSGSV